MAENVLKNPARALETVANLGTAFASRSPKTASSSLPEVINFYQTGERLYLGNFFQILSQLTSGKTTTKLYSSVPLENIELEQ